MDMKFKGSVEKHELTKILTELVSLTSIAAELLEGLEPSCLPNF